VDLGWRTGAEREGAGRRETRGGSADGGRGSGEEMPVEVSRVLTVVLVEKMLQFFFFLNHVKINMEISPENFAERILKDRKKYITIFRVSCTSHR
jgi:hypothetical protein